MERHSTNEQKREHELEQVKGDMVEKRGETYEAIRERERGEKECVQGHKEEEMKIKRKSGDKEGENMEGKEGEREIHEAKNKQVHKNT